VTRASRFLTGWVTRFATHDAIPAGRPVTTQRQTTTPKQAGPKPGRVAPVLKKAADATSRPARPARTRLMPAPRYQLSARSWSLAITRITHMSVSWRPGARSTRSASSARATG
jgi:hypothetical protein